MKKKTSADIAAESAAEIRRELERWKYLQEHGGSDPFWPDGCNMNLVRNHVIYAKRKCEDMLMPEQYPEEYYLATPPEVDNDFMARKEEIAAHARTALSIYKKNQDYLFLLESISRLDTKNADKTHIGSVLNCVNALESAIENGEYPVMRRHERSDCYLNNLNSFRSCRAQVEKILGKNGKELPEGQLSIFDLFY